MAETAPPKRSGLASFLVDYGPILLFFLVYKYNSPANRSDVILEVAAVLKGTLAFVGGAIAAFAFSLIRYKHVPPMLWLSTALIVGFGLLTYFLHDPVWIQIKPTVIYVLFGLALLAGVMRGRALLKILLGVAFEGLDDAGWMILSRNWGWFFLFLAVLNEVLRQFFNVANGNFGTWITLKLWLFMPLSFIFTFLHMPMLMRHGLASEAKDGSGTE
jgi:intracellular septation protein